MLSRYLEEEGVPTTQISLVRVNTKKIRPPRALWVPFEFGRPLGIPNDPAFQKRVLVQALRLLEAESGPVLEDFPEDAPVTDDYTVLACPFVPHVKETDEGGMEKLCNELRLEIGQLRPWYDRALKERGRTAVGVSKLGLGENVSFLCSFLLEYSPQNPRTDVTIGQQLRYAADDLKAFYFEAITAQPNAEKLSGEGIEKWFWNSTLAARVLRLIKEKVTGNENAALKLAANHFIVPAKYS